MSKRSVVRGIVLPLALLAAAGWGGHFAEAADATAITAHLDGFTSPDGVNYFAVSLKPTAVAAPVTPHDIVVLFNTSAGQTGEYRSKALEALKSFLAALGREDRVRLVAVDLNAAALTNTFVSPNGKEMGEALAALDARVPLGASDMAKGIAAIVGSYTGESKNARAAIYIGDGRSAAHLLMPDEFEKLATQLADARIPVSSYVIGVRTDPQLLGALAAQTGGTLEFASDTLAAAEAGKRLAAAADAPVLWPSKVTWSAEVAEVLPKRLPPLRGDRETVVLGTMKTKQAGNVEVALDGPAGADKVSVALPTLVSDDTNSYLATLVQQARADGGVTLPLVGTASLAEARQATTTGVRTLSQLARQALAAGNAENAQQIVNEALRRDPNDSEALVLKSAIAKRNQNNGQAAANTPPALPPAAATPPALPPAAAPAAGGTNDLNLVGPGEPPPGTMVEEFEHNQRVQAQIIQAEVQTTVSRARSLMSTDPDLAIQELQLLQERVRRATALNPDVRSQYLVTIEAALREASRRKVEFEFARQQRQENVAAARERMLAAQNLIRNQEKVRQLMDRFNSLMNEGRYRLAEEAAAAEAVKVAPGNPVPEQAALFGRTKGYYEAAMALRLERQKGVVDTLHEVEKSHVPMPDEPPIVYPNAEVWQQLTARRKQRYSSMDLSSKGSAEKKIEDALKSPTQIEFTEAALSDVIDYLKDLHKIEIQIDSKALSEVGIEPSAPVTRNLKGISLRSALRLMLRDLGLTYLIKNEVLLITTPEEADNQLTTKVYPVADLVLPIPPPGSMGGMGGMGMGGGMGGMGMGGMGGGMGGMGMGGMGGGMGGMGMGMGGGMFNLPRDLLPKVPQGGFQAFAVKDDLDKPAAEQGQAPANVALPQSVDHRPAKIEVEVGKDAKPEAVWEEYFSKNEPQPTAVRDAVRSLVKQQKFDHVIALINSALRHHQGQPWMYEGLALALDAAGRPKAEIERAVMSAVDFVDNSADLMYVGAYLSRIGLHERALQIYRQAAALDPIRPEPYMLGLQAARAANDIDGLKWASVGILSQAWPQQEASVWQAGLGISKEVLDKLRTEKRIKEADAFLAQLDEAVRRDCVAVVTWTGDADVDVMVEEPSGTVCSLRNPRTTGGGVLLGDDIRQAGRDSFGGRSAAYVCPKGFDGTYRLLVRRVWGNVTAGKVNVEVITHCNTADAVDVRKKIALDKDEALVVFDLKGGRRTEPLREQQVANAVGGQMVLNRQILAQQLATTTDPAALAAMANARSGGSSSGSNNGAYPYFGGGAVGYQPVITVLPQGANFSVTAVVSADRRYVRITSAPFFSGISQVNTFNMTTGASQSQTGGTGNQGYSGAFGGTGNSGAGSGVF